MRSVLLLGDTHYGSDFAAFPEQYMTKSGSTICASGGQLELLKIHYDMVDFAKAKKVDTIIHCGDIIDGNSRKEQGCAFLTVKYIDAQIDIAYNLLLPLVKGRRLYMHSGSGYHHSIDTNVIETLRARFDGVTKEVEDFGPIKSYSIDGYVYHSGHGEGAPRKLLSGWLQDQINDWKIAVSDDKLDPIDCFVRGHWHRMCVVKDPKVLGLLLPAQKTFSPDKIHNKSVARMHGDYGFAWHLIENGKLVDEEYRTYKTPRFSDFIREA